MNSSPPVRATESIVRRWRSSTWPTRKAASPARWPSRSFTDLKWSRSPIMTEKGVPAALGARKLASSSLSNASLFLRPVSGR